MHDRTLQEHISRLAQTNSNAQCSLRCFASVRSTHLISRKMLPASGSITPPPVGSNHCEALMRERAALKRINQ